MKISFAQIAELNRPHRQREVYTLLDGVVVPKFSAQTEPGTEFVYLPLSIACLQSYVEEHAAEDADYEFLPPVYKRIPMEEAIEALIDADLVGFSCYVWNEQLSLKIAKALKERKPEIKILFGGPQVPDNPVEFLEKNHFVDLTIHGEGERAFLKLLKAFKAEDWASVPSLGYRDESGQAILNIRAPRMRDMSEAPSAYASGVLAPLVDSNPETKWLAMWETNRGCPFSCTYCDWGSAVGAKVSRFEMDRLQAEINWFVENKITHVFICDANFGILPRDVEIAESLVSAYEAAGLPVAISIQNTKNASERSFQIQQIFSKSKLVHFGATLSMQSVSTETLKAIKRSNISLEAFNDLHVKFRDAGVETYTDLIVGLPGETYDSFVEGLDIVMNQGQHNRIAFYNCSVLPNAAMAAPDYIAEHGIETIATPIVHEHEDLDRTDRSDAVEYIDTVIATKSMNRADWIKTRVYAWMVDALHFNRLTQIIATATHAAFGLRYRTIYEAIASADQESYPILAEVRSWLTEQAERIQKGEPEFIPSKKHLNIWWPGDQYVVVKLVSDRKLDGFYEEVRRLLKSMLASRSISDDDQVIDDAVALNQSSYRIPREFEDLVIETKTKLWEFAQAEISGQAVDLDKTPAKYQIDRHSSIWVSNDGFCEDVICQYYRRTEFLYPVQRLPEATSGSLANDFSATGSEASYQSTLQ